MCNTKRWPGFNDLIFCAHSPYTPPISQQFYIAVAGLFNQFYERTPKQRGVTLAPYNALQPGMSYAQVVAILGEPKSELSRSSSAGYETVRYDALMLSLSIAVCAQDKPQPDRWRGLVLNEATSADAIKLLGKPDEEKTNRTAVAFFIEVCSLCTHELREFIKRAVSQ
jgi:hypothetical protein